MTDSIHDFVVAELQRTKGHWAIVARETDIPLRSLEKIARKEWKNPGVKTIERLAKHFREMQPE